MSFLDNFKQATIEKSILDFLQNTVCSGNTTCDGYVNSSYAFYLTYIQNIIGQILVGIAFGFYVLGLFSLTVIWDWLPLSFR